MADTRAIGDNQQLPNLTSLSSHFVVAPHLRHKHTRAGDYVVGGGETHLLHHDAGGHHDSYDRDEVKKVKIEGIDVVGLDEDSMLEDDLKPAQLVVGVGDGIQGMGLGVAYFATTGSIKSPIFEGIPSLTPEWLLKKVWLKVNGDLEQSVLASLISKDMGPKLRQEIRTFLERRGEIQTGNRIDLKSTIMQAVEITITCQKEKPTLAILRDSKQRRKREKQEKNLNIGLTPYGQIVCMEELQLKKRPVKMASGMGMTMGGDHNTLSSLSVNIPTTSNNNINHSPPINHSPSINHSSSMNVPHSPLSSVPHHGMVMNQMMWKPNNSSAKDMNDELLKKYVQVGDLSGQLINMKDELQIMKEECHKKDLIIAELKSIIMDLKPSFVLPPHLISATSSPPHDGSVHGVSRTMLHNRHLHSHQLHAHSLPHHSHPHHLHPLHHQTNDPSQLLHMVDHPNLMTSESMMTQTVGDHHQSYLPQ